MQYKYNIVSIKNEITEKGVIRSNEQNEIKESQLVAVHYKIKMLKEKILHALVVILFLVSFFKSLIRPKAYMDHKERSVNSSIRPLVNGELNFKVNG